MDTSTQPTVFVVDDDPGMRNALRRLVTEAGLCVVAYPSAAAFLDDFRPERPGCLLLDVRMPAMSGPQLQAKLDACGAHLPIIYLTGYGTVPLAVGAMKAGAMDFIEKPFDNAALLQRVRDALVRDTRERALRAERESLRQSIATLTPREREVMDFMAAGRSSKEIARTLDISTRTVEIHRARVMAKLAADSVADLVRKTLAASDAADT